MIILFKNAHNSYGWALIQALSYVAFEYDENIFQTKIDSDIGCIVDVDLEHTKTVKNKTR